MDLKSIFSARLERLENKKKNASSEEVNVDKLFEKYYLEWKESSKEGKTPNTISVIPKFYHKLPSDDDQLQFKLREESRSVFLRRRSQELLDNDELKELWILLEKYQSSPSLGGDDQMINYHDFLKVSELAGEKCKQYFLPSTFCKLLQSDPYGRISVMNFFNYVMRKVWLHQTRIGLSLYDVAGQGYLRESDLESYILDLLPSIPELNELQKSFHSFYICTAVRKFFFFLDPLHTGQIKIQDILACSFLDDLLELRDEDLPKEQQQNNWFSAPSALRVYGMYLNLDKDHN
ncbi:UNVERIFIED_CONTAM: hypothetical protein GTU68_051027, partial [Idotea baltica]|nr:hypothetical protein [Idotea baltica]